jgi:AraC-like DNA-binding protein
LVNEVRYEIARQLLANTYMPISQIAATLDYKDAPYFLPRLSPLVRQSAG